MTTATSTVAYIVTVTKKPEQVEAYLYGYARQLTTAPVLGGESTIVLIEVRGERAEGYAQGQAERLSSGLHFSVVKPTLTQALAHVSEVFGVEV